MRTTDAGQQLDEFRNEVRGMVSGDESLEGDFEPWQGCHERLLSRESAAPETRVVPRERRRAHSDDSVASGL